MHDCSDWLMFLKAKKQPTKKTCQKAHKNFSANMSVYQSGLQLFMVVLLVKKKKIKCKQSYNSLTSFPHSWSPSFQFLQIFLSSTVILCYYFSWTLCLNSKVKSYLEHKKRTKCSLNSKTYLQQPTQLMCLPLSGSLSFEP